LIVQSHRIEKKWRTMSIRDNPQKKKMWYEKHCVQREHSQEWRKPENAASSSPNDT